MYDIHQMDIYEYILYKFSTMTPKKVIADLEIYTNTVRDRSRCNFVLRSTSPSLMAVWPSEGYARMPERDCERCSSFGERKGRKGKGARGKERERETEREWISRRVEKEQQNHGDERCQSRACVREEDAKRIKGLERG